jgi:hypothetical protein
MLRLSALAFILLFLPKFTVGQTPAEFPPIAIGEWRQHLPWQRARYVTQSSSQVYFATRWAVVEIDKAERSPRFLTKVEGLSDAGMGIIRFNPGSNSLLLTYTNSNIDIWHPDDRSVTNLPFIVNNLNLSGDKQIYNACFDDQFAYLACGFGVVKLDMQNEEVVFTTFTGLPVKAVELFDGFIYAGTEEGLFRIPVDDVNPEDFSRWEMLGPTQGFQGGDIVSALATAYGKLFIGIEKTFSSFDGLTLTPISSEPTFDLIYLTTEGEGLVIGWEFGFNGKVQHMDASGAISDVHWACQATKPIYAVEDGNKQFWFADEQDEFRYYDAINNKCDQFSFNSPYNHLSTEIDIANGKVLIGTPGHDINLNPSYARNGVYIYEEGFWNRFSYLSNPELEDDDCQFDLWKVAAHPSEDKFFAGGFVGGLVEAVENGNSTQRFTQYNSLLQNAGASGNNRTAIGGVAFDKDNNLWISNYDANAPIAVLKSDGTFRNFSAAPVNNLLQVVVDNNGYKWFVVGFNGGILVYDSGADLDSPADDRYRHITTANSVLPTNTINCLAVDLEGDVWVGTQQGTISFECGSNVFDASVCQGSRRIASVGDFGAYLLANQEIRSIAVDGANRKWFGTTNGIFVQSPSGEDPEARFTDTNSPLFDNIITDIAIDQTSGEVWVGTDKGVISLRGEATVGGRINTRMPYAYPNPVRPDYDGPIAIYGLAKDANVKITDVSGKLVYEGQALGGQAVWDGRDYLGRRAASGVYLVFATSSESFENPDAVIAKVVILN